MIYFKKIIKKLDKHIKDQNEKNKKFKTNIIKKTLKSF